jgi:hypothetical protein
MGILMIILEFGFLYVSIAAGIYVLMFSIIVFCHIIKYQNNSR